MLTPLELLAAFGLDLLIGDPRSIPHPVEIVGKLINRLAQTLRPRFNDRIAGILLTGIVTITVFLVSMLLEFILRLAVGVLLNLALGLIFIYFVSSTLAVKGLLGSVRGVLEARNIDAARSRLSKIVGRDTQNLDEKAVHRAAIETLAENASDGIIAPLFYLALGGFPLAMAYKAVNTLDSMVGYKHHAYKDFGWASARLDDILNFFPARITGLLIVGAAYLLSGFNAKAARRSFDVMLKDGRNNTSPNSGMPEAAMAGALHVRLGGPATYQGVTVDKPYINAQASAEIKSHGRRAIRLTLVSACMGLVLAAFAVYLRRVL